MKKISIKRNTVLILSLISTVIIFAVLCFLEKKIANPNGFEQVYVVKEDVKEGQIFTEKNFDEYFKLEKRDRSTITPFNIVSKEQVIGKYAKENFYKKEAVNSKKIEDNKARLDIKNKRITSLKFADISSIVGGTLKKGDRVDILLTLKSNDQEVKTTTKLQNIYVDEIFSGDGTVIDRDTDTKTPALAINLLLSAKQGTELENAAKSGEIQIMKVADSTTYTPMTVTNN